MDLSSANQKNLAYILKEIGTKLGVVNTTLFDPEDYNLEKYDDLKWLYDHLMAKDSLSVSETQAFIEELSTIRK
ncbi:DUF1128 domain-containing protein [Amphibacillus cookii]|uniref:DUF1128 domain-containing protein n=1 Tax=Amphibacillus cookii TaxID=767787 RepID=UPI0019587AEA|nr:DUF1128 domain-containing protein [Amphibacillus cookii]MBM7540545.1 uncharacterized protein YfkK (UPF0435 family) [Amphibacillus cookii]